MKTRLLRVAVLALLALGGAGLPTACSYENNEDLLGNSPPAPDCDTLSVVKYSAQVAPLLQQRCISCHNTAQPIGNVSLSTHAQVLNIARTGLLVGVINHAPGFDPMPQGSPKLSDCEVAIIRKWVKAGAPNN